jgi:hypothetical protein
MESQSSKARRVRIFLWKWMSLVTFISMYDLVIHCHVDKGGIVAILYANRIDKSEIPPESLICELDGFWQSLTHGDGLPARSHIDPSKISPSLLPWIFMVDVLRDGEALDYRCRLAGSENVRLLGREPTGKLLSSIFVDQEKEFLLETFNVTVQEKRPTYWLAAVPHDKQEYVTIHRGLFPLSTDGMNVDILIAAAVPERRPTGI